MVFILFIAVGGAFVGGVPLKFELRLIKGNS